jgi:oxaloacetate decarboxylase gamma subunit
MNITEMLEQSGVLTLLGMGVVFSFLIILIFAISGVGKIINALKLNKEIMTNTLAAAPSASVNVGSITAVISAAVKEYRKSNK